MSTGAFVAITVVVSISSAIPPAIFPMMFAVHGTIAKTSAAFARDMCLISHDFGSSNVSIATGLPERD